MDTDVKIFNKILAHQTQRHVTHCFQVGFIPGMQGWFNIRKSISVIHHINGIKGEKKHKIISDKIKCPFLITLRKLGIERNFLNMMRAFIFLIHS